MRPRPDDRADALRYAFHAGGLVPRSAALVSITPARECRWLRDAVERYAPVERRAQPADAANRDG
jgi:hypothetical protein